jgi:hypothetical protein
MRAGRRGMAVQLDPIPPTLKAPGNKRLKLKYGEPLSNFAFKFNFAPLHRGRSNRRAGAPQRDSTSDVDGSGGRGLLSFPSPLKLSLLCSFPLNLSLLCPPYDPN